MYIYDKKIEIINILPNPYQNEIIQRFILIPIFKIRDIIKSIIIMSLQTLNSNNININVNVNKNNKNNTHNKENKCPYCDSCQLTPYISINKKKNICWICSNCKRQVQQCITCHKPKHVDFYNKNCSEICMKTHWINKQKSLKNANKITNIVSDKEIFKQNFCAECGITMEYDGETECCSIACIQEYWKEEKID